MQLKWIDARTLRTEAEDLIASDEASRHVPEGGDRTSYELLVYQTELEMQNQALRDAQSELMASEARYRDLFESAPIAYLVLDATSRITSVNPVARELFGATAVGTRLSQYLQPDEAIAFERYRRQVLGASDRFAGEFTMIDARGRRREIRVDALRTTTEGAEWRATITDVTAQNVVMRKLNHSERLGAVGEHASSIAHDLNNLLYSIAGHTELALHYLNQEHPTHQPLMQLRKVVERCAAATAQLANYSRAETQRASVLDLNEAIADMEVVVRSLLGDNIDLEIATGATDASIRVDKSQVEQILLTAMRNAQHAMPLGGRFRVETENLVLGRDSQVGAVRYVRWTMSDTGVGMIEDTRRRAFEPFFSTKPAGSGTGLGLSIVKGIVERAGGSALLESELGRGTSLVIHLPCVSGSSVSSRPAPPPRQPPTTVMIVEQSPEIRARLSARLSEAGCDVVQSTEAAEALEQLKRIADRVAVLLVDEGLPGSTEHEFLGAVAAVAPFVQVVITSFVTGETTPPTLKDDVIDAVADRVLTAVSRLNQ